MSKLKYLAMCFCAIVLLLVNSDSYKLQAIEVSNNPPTVSHSTINLIISFEGIRNKPYYDSEGWLTTGIGHQIKPNEQHLLKPLTDDQVHTLLKRDLSTCEATINDRVMVSLNQNQFDALASLCFNIGPDRFSISRVVRLINKGEFRAAAQAFFDWSLPSVLVKRRQIEKNLFLADI